MHIEGNETHDNYQVDLKGDGLPDLLLDVETELLDAALEGATSVVLEAVTETGEVVKGTATLEIVLWRWRPPSEGAALAASNARRPGIRPFAPCGTTAVLTVLRFVSTIKSKLIGLSTSPLHSAQF